MKLLVIELKQDANGVDFQLKQVVLPSGAPQPTKIEQALADEIVAHLGKAVPEIATRLGACGCIVMQGDPSNS